MLKSNGNNICGFGHYGTSVSCNDLVNHSLYPCCTLKIVSYALVCVSFSS